MGYGIGQVIMAVTLSSRLEISRTRFNEKNKVVNDISALSINSIHSHDEENAQEHDTTLRFVNELIKFNGFNDMLSLAELTK